MLRTFFSSLLVWLALHIAAFGAASVTAADQVMYPSNNGLWTFGEASGTTGNDTNANATKYNCTLAGATLAQPSVDGSSATAITFSGSSSGCTFAYAGNAASSGTTAPFAITCASVAGNCTAVGMTIPLHVEMDIKCTSTSACENTLVGDADTSAHVGWSLELFDDGTTSCSSTACMMIEFDWHGTVNRATVDEKTTISKASMGAGTSHHIKFDYDGNGCISNHTTGYLDGVLGTPSVQVDDCNDASVAISKQPGIGIASAFWGANNSTFQNVAVYTTQYPPGANPHLCCSGNGYRDALAFYHANLVKNNAAPIANPTGVPNLIFEKDCSDVDDWATFQQIIQLNNANKIHLIGMASNSPNTHCASGMQTFLNYWSSTVPVMAYQGSSGNPADDGYGNAETHFRPNDGTNSGLTEPPTIAAAGTGYVVGDQLTWPIGSGVLGSSCPYSSNRTATLKVDTVSSGGITAWHLVYPGCYSTAPSLTGVALTGGTGSGAQGTATTCHDRCLYQDGEWAITALVAANSNTYILNSGQSGLDSLLWANHAATMNGGHLVAYLLMQGDIFTGAAEFNASNVASQWTTLYGGGSPQVTVPILFSDNANTADIGGACCSPNSQAYIYAGVQTTAQSSTNPVQYGYNASANTTSLFVISSGTYNTSTGATTITMTLPYLTGIVGGTASVSSCASSCSGLNGNYTITGVNPAAGTVSFTAATGLGSLTISGGNLATGAITRTDWDFPLLQWLSAGISLTGAAPANFNYYAANGVTMTNTSGALTWTTTPGISSYIRRTASDATENGWIYTIQNMVPGGGEPPQIPLKGAANDNVALKPVVYRERRQ